MCSWLLKVVEELQKPEWTANFISSAATAAVGVLVAVFALRKQLSHDRSERRAERNVVLVEPLARALREDASEFPDMFGDPVILTFRGVSFRPGLRRGQYPGQEAVVEAMDTAKPALPAPRAVLQMLADRQDRWEVLDWVHQVRRENLPITGGMENVVDGLDVHGLINGKRCPHLIYIDGLPKIQERVFSSSIEREEQLGLELHQWDGTMIPEGWESLPTGVPLVSDADLSALVQEVVSIFNEEEGKIWQPAD